MLPTRHLKYNPQNNPFRTELTEKEFRANVTTSPKVLVQHMYRLNASQMNKLSELKFAFGWIHGRDDRRHFLQVLCCMWMIFCKIFE